MIRTSFLRLKALSADTSKQAGLNLNLFGALSGAFSSKQKKTTQQNADGSSTTTEDKHDKGKHFVFQHFRHLISPFTYPCHVTDNHIQVPRAQQPGAGEVRMQQVTRSRVV
jgi:hypothetical protein